MATGFRIGSGFVEVAIEDRTRRDRERIQAQIEGIPDRRVAITAATRTAERNLQRLRTEAEGITQERRMEIDANIRIAEVNLRRLRAEAETATGDRRIEIDARIQLAERGLARLRQQADAVSEQREIEVNAQTAEAMRQLQLLRDQAEALDREEVTLRANVADLDRALDRTKKLKGHLDSLEDSARSVMRGFASVGAVVSGVGSLLGPVTSVVLAVADGVAAVGSSLAATAPALALAPSVIGGWMFLKSTITAVGDSIAESLAPMTDAFTKAQQHAGDLAQHGIGKIADAFNRVNLPNMAAAMDRIGVSANRNATFFGNWVNSAPGIKLIKDTTDGVAAAFERALPSITGAAISLGDMANRGDVAARLTAIGDAIGDAADKFNAWTDNVTGADIDGAFQRIGDAAGFVVDKVKAVRDIIGWLADHQDAIRGFSDAFAGIGIVLGAATGNWVAVVAGAVTLILNHFDTVKQALAGLWGAASDTFTRIANDPWVQKIKADVMEIAGLIRDDFAAGVDWLRGAWERLQPAIERAWQVLGPFVHEVLANSQVQDGLRAWAALLGGAAFALLAFGAAAAATSALVTGTLGAVVAWLTGVFIDSVRSAFEDTTGFLTAIPGAVSAAWSAVTGTVSAAVQAVLGFFEQIPAQLSAVWQTVVSTASAAWQSVVATVSAVPGQVIGFIGQMASQVPYLIGFMVGQVVALFVSLAAGAVAALVALPGQVAAVFTSARDQAVALATSMVSTVVSTAQTLPGRVASAISSLVSTVTSTFTSARDQAVSTTTSLVSTVVSTAATLPGRVASAISSLASQVAAQFNAARTQAVSVATSLVSQVVSTVASLPGRAASALSGIGGVLAGAGRSLIQGFIDGVRSMIPSLDGVLGSITSRIPNVKGPPEKDRVLLEPAGRLVMQGFMAGLRKETPALDAQLGDVTSLVGRAGGGTSAAPAGGGGTHYHFAPGSITLDASKIRDLRDLLDMIDGVRSTARQYGAVPVGV